jgi:hypothetical protein
LNHFTVPCVIFAFFVLEAAPAPTTRVRASDNYPGQPAT